MTSVQTPAEAVKVLSTAQHELAAAVQDVSDAAAALESARADFGLDPSQANRDELEAMRAVVTDVAEDLAIRQAAVAEAQRRLDLAIAEHDKERKTKVRAEAAEASRAGAVIVREIVTLLGGITRISALNERMRTWEASVAGPARQVGGSVTRFTVPEKARWIWDRMYGAAIELERRYVDELDECRQAYGLPESEGDPNGINA